jgi:hypothetical protein
MRSVQLDHSLAWEYSRDQLKQPGGPPRVPGQETSRARPLWTGTTTKVQLARSQGRSAGREVQPTEIEPAYEVLLEVLQCGCCLLLAVATESGCFDFQEVLTESKREPLLEPW